MPQMSLNNRRPSSPPPACVHRARPLNKAWAEACPEARPATDPVRADLLRPGQLSSACTRARRRRGIRPEGTFLSLLPVLEDLLREGFRRAALEFLVAARAIAEELRARILGWARRIVFRVQKNRERPRLSGPSRLLGACKRSVRRHPGQFHGSRGRAARRDLLLHYLLRVTPGGGIRRAARIGVDTAIGRAAIERHAD